MMTFWQSSAHAEIDAERRAELLDLLRQDCGSCHGLTLKGGLGPPLTPDALATRDAATLTAIILNGVPGTPMPPWTPILAPEEARWLVGILRGVEEPKKP